MTKVLVCQCGHKMECHHVNHSGPEYYSYCKEYLYHDFDMKCHCQQYVPFCTLSEEADIRRFTDETDLNIESL